MVPVESFLFARGDILYGLIAGLLFLLPLRRRPGFAWRFPVGAAAAFLVLALVWTLRAPLLTAVIGWLQAGRFPDSLPAVLINTVWTYLFILPVLMGVFRFCSDLPSGQLFYAAVCAVISDNLAFIIFLAIFPQMSRVFAAANDFRPFYFWMDLLIHAVVYTGIYVSFATRLPRDREYRFRVVHCGVTMLLIFVVLRSFGVYSRALFGMHAHRVILVICTGLLLLLFFLQMVLKRAHAWHEVAAMNANLLEAQQREFRQYREDSETVKKLGHDLKYLIAALSVEDGERQSEIIENMKRIVAGCEEHMDTGNGVLDAILSIAWKRCREEGVAWTCVADGTALQDISTADMCLILGNAFENAIEGALQMEEPEQRRLSLDIRRKGGGASIKLTNSCAAEPVFKDGLPVTTKAETELHGYGMRSIRDIAERYGGAVSMYARDGVFTLDIMLPAPSTHTHTPRRARRSKIEKPRKS